MGSVCCAHCICPGRGSRRCTVLALVSDPSELLALLGEMLGEAILAGFRAMLLLLLLLEALVRHLNSLHAKS